MFANNRDGTFSEISGPLGDGLIDDSRTFVLADLDHDGRLEVILKNRNAPQLRILHNSMKELGQSISFRLRGVKSNRDAIGAAITVDAGALHQRKSIYRQVQDPRTALQRSVFWSWECELLFTRKYRWPSGLVPGNRTSAGEQQDLIEEGSEKFTAKPFVATAARFCSCRDAPEARAASFAGEHVAIDPLKAPEFSLPNLLRATCAT